MLKRFSCLTLLFLGSISAQAVTPAKYSVDANHSTVGFTIPILNGVSKVRGKFTEFTVNIDYDEANVTASSVRATIKTASIDTGIEARDRHLRTADFFDVEKYPEITFQSTRVEKKGRNFVAIGTFTMHGVSKEIEIPFTVAGKYLDPAKKQTLVGFAGNLVINRRDYGMTWRHSTISNWVGDMVHIDLAILVKTPPAKAGA